MPPAKFDSPKVDVPAVVGTNNTVGVGEAVGVYGHSDSGRGVKATSQTGYGLRASSIKSAAIRASSTDGVGVESGSDNSDGVLGFSKTGGNGVRGNSVTGKGVMGHCDNGTGVFGESGTGGTGVYGTSNSGWGVWGHSEDSQGVHASTRSTKHAAMAAIQHNGDSDSPAFFAEHTGKRRAARFVGNVEVTGDITLTNADCAEDFDISDGSPSEPGTVMVLDGESNLRECDCAYDKRVAGVLSGAGEYKPALVLDKQPSPRTRKPVALLGKVFCKVDAQFGSIEVGDLLTTSPTAGHAMRVDDPLRAFGAVIGKALRPLSEGQGLIPILIALQ